MTLTRVLLMRLASIAACAVLVMNAACELPPEPVLDNQLDPSSASYKAFPPSISWLSQNSENGCWLIISVIEPYATTLHVERKNGTAGNFREVVTRTSPFVGFTDTTGVLLVDSVYTYRARVRTPGGAYSGYSVEKSFKARTYPSGS